jgi:outer membrane protein assembly factor BamB
MLYSDETEEENMRRVLWGVLFLLATLAVQASYEPLWQYNGPETILFAPTLGNDGSVYFATADEKLRALTPQGTPAWAIKPGGLVITPVVLHGGVLYFGTSSLEIRAYSTAGTMVWKRSVGANAATPLAVAADGKIYFGGADGDLYALNPDGSQRFRVPLGEEVGPPTVGHDGTIFITGDNFMHAINPQNGMVIWRKNFFNASRVPVVMDRYDDLFYIREGILDVYNVHGQFLWEARDEQGNLLLVKRMAPVIYGDIVVAVDDGGSEIYGLDVSTGSILWVFSDVNTEWTPEVTASMAVDRNGIVAYLDATGVIAWFDAVDGSFYGYMPSMGEGKEAVLLGWGIKGRVVTRTGEGTKVLTAYAVPAGPGGSWSQGGMSARHVQRRDDEPFTAVNSPGDGSVITGTFTVSGTASDDFSLGKVELYIGQTKVASSDVGTLLWSANSALFDDGTYDVSLLATDSAGNVGVNTVTVTFDNPAPVYNLSQGPPTFTWLDNLVDNQYQVLVSMDPTFTTPVVTSSTQTKRWIRATSWKPSDKKWAKVLAAANLVPSPQVTVYWRVIGRIGGEVTTRSFTLDKTH